MLNLQCKYLINSIQKFESTKGDSPMKPFKKLGFVLFLSLLLSGGFPLPSPQGLPSWLSLHLTQARRICSFLMIPSPAGAIQITSPAVLNSRTIVASGNASSAEIDLRSITANGAFSIWYTITGSGTAKIEYQTSPRSGGTFISPASETAITDKTAGSYHQTINPVIAPYMKIKVTETGGASSITITLYLIIQ
jgi:hypothetical protein